MQRQSNLLRPLNCSICFENNEIIFSTETFVSIGCRHFFHLHCFKDYVVTRREEDPCVSCCDRQRSCPVCRNHITEINYEGKSMNVQQMFEKCTWQAYKKSNSLSSKHDGAVALISRIGEIAEQGMKDILLSNDHCIVLRYLANNFGCADLKEFLNYMVEKISHRKNKYHVLHGYMSLPSDSINM